MQKLTLLSSILAKNEPKKAKIILKNLDRPVYLPVRNPRPDRTEPAVYRYRLQHRLYVANLLRSYAFLYGGMMETHLNALITLLHERV